LFGSMRAFALHDQIVSQRVRALAGRIDLIHTWPLGALRTLETAIELGIPTVLERPNAHTRYAYQAVQNECERMGITLPRDHEHAYNSQVLQKEEQEYNLADFLLCPSDFVVQTFIDQGFPENKLLRHQYGFDESLYHPTDRSNSLTEGLVMLFAGVCAVRKGLHYALEGWLRSSACDRGTFLIAGEFLPEYEQKLSSMLSHPSVKVLGHRSDLPELMISCDVLVLPSIEEGSALVTSEARGSGCVLLVSEAAGANCQHMHDAMVHRVGDVGTLSAQITMLDKDRRFLQKLREASLSTMHQLTWIMAGRKLLDVYSQVLVAKQSSKSADVMTFAS